MHGNLLDEETVKRGLNGGQKLRYLVLGVQLDGAHNSLLLIYMRLGQLDAHKQVLAAHGLVGALRHGITVGRGGTGGGLLLRLRICMAARRQYINRERLGCHALATHDNRGRTDMAFACRRGLVNHRVLLARATA